jgi:hypothetical protein
MMLVPFSIIILLGCSEKLFDEVVSVRRVIVRKSGNPHCGPPGAPALERVPSYAS